MVSLIRKMTANAIIIVILNKDNCINFGRKRVSSRFSTFEGCDLEEFASIGDWLNASHILIYYFLYY